MHEIQRGERLTQPVPPEHRDLTVRGQDSAERHQDTDEERIDEGGENGVGSVCRYKLAYPGVKELIDRHLKVDGSGDSRGEGQADYGIPAGEVEEGADKEVGYFGDNLGENELQQSQKSA